jgi:hypothetical protein
MTAKTLFVRHVQTGEIKKVTEEQRSKQDRNFWVLVTGDVKETKPADVPVGVDAAPESKTTSKATTPTK